MDSERHLEDDLSFFFLSTLLCQLLGDLAPDEIVKDVAHGSLLAS